MDEKKYFYKKVPGFTIIELLVAIAVIGILSSLIYISYSGISQKAKAKALESDLISASVQLEQYRSFYGAYPTSLDEANCPPTSDGSYCLKFSDNIVVSYLGNDQKYLLSTTNVSADISYSVNESGVISELVTFANAMGGTGSDNANSVSKTSDGGYIVAGQTLSYGVSNRSNAYIAKYAADGRLSWINTWNRTGYDYGVSAIQTLDGGYAMTGEAYNSSGTNSDVFLAKYDKSGNLSWSRTWGGTGIDSGQSIIQTSDGDYVITGYTQSFGAGDYDLILIKYSASGDLIWNRTWGGTGVDKGYGVVQTSDGGYAVTGNTNSYGAGYVDVLLVKFDTDGNLLWNKTWGGPDYDYSHASIIQTKDNSLVITGSTLSYSVGSQDLLLIKFAADGSLIWSSTWGGAGADYGRSVIQTIDGGYAVAGYTASYGAGGNDMVLAKFKPDGSFDFGKTFGGAGADYGYSLIQMFDGNYIVVGYTDSFGGGSGDTLIAKYDLNGSIANCSISICTSPTATFSYRSAIIGSPTASVANPTVTVLSPSITATSPTVKITDIVKP